MSPDEVQKDRTRFGNVLETFVFAELLKHTATADGDYRLMYYRDTDKFEVDVVIENAAGQKNNWGRIPIILSRSG